MKLTKEDKQLIMSCLIFTSCVETCADYKPEDSLAMIKLAERIKESEGFNFPDNLEISDFCGEEDYEEVFELAKRMEKEPRN